jgi:hypothetical protein
MNGWKAGAVFALAAIVAAPAMALRDPARRSADSRSEREAGGKWKKEGQGKMRGLDRNGDGVITRAEWRGNDRSFQRHDHNGDGVISRSDVRAGGKKSKD